jgi:dihydroxyacetone kinase-like protein
MSGKLTPLAIAAAVRNIAREIPGMREALNAADRELGDGDTGMTIASVVAAWVEALEPTDDVGAALQQLGRATRRATGSSLGGVLATGLVAAGKAAAGRSAADRDAIVAMLDAATSAFGERSGAMAGDKSFLDTLLDVREAIAAAGQDASLHDVAIAGAERALEAFRPREARLGRARIFGARSAGLDDPGMLAALMLLRAARAA